MVGRDAVVAVMATGVLRDGETPLVHDAAGPDVRVVGYEEGEVPYAGEWAMDDSTTQTTTEDLTPPLTIASLTETIHTFRSTVTLEHFAPLPGGGPTMRDVLGWLYPVRYGPPPETLADRWFRRHRPGRYPQYPRRRNVDGE